MGAERSGQRHGELGPPRVHTRLTVDGLKSRDGLKRSDGRLKHPKNLGGLVVPAQVDSGGLFFFFPVDLPWNFRENFPRFRQEVALFVNV